MNKAQYIRYAFSIFVKNYSMPQNQSYSLSDLMNELQMVIRSSFDQSYWVVAELANVSGSARGHMYMELVEKSESQIIAKARANLWSSRRQQIVAAFEDVTKETIKAGMKVLLQLSVDFHPIYGLSFQVLDIDPSYSLGELERQKQETIKRITEEGLLDFNKQYVLSSVIQNIAIISSETAAGYQDFMNQLDSNTNLYKFNTKLYPAIMQGEQAPSSIIKAIELIDKSEILYDAVVVIRGGGSNLDLACFDDYHLSARLAQSFYPVFSGIGHERDQSVVDMIAHTRLKTPTAVAEHIIQYNFDFENRIMGMFSDLIAFSKDRLEEEKYQVEKLSLQMTDQSSQLILKEKVVLRNLSFQMNKNSISQIHQNVILLKQKKTDISFFSHQVFQRYEQGCKYIIQHLKTEIKEFIYHQKNQIPQFKSLQSLSSLYIDKESNKIDYLKYIIKISNPDTILKKGFSITRQNGKAISRIDQIDEKEILETTLYKGVIKSKILKDQNHG